MTESGSEGEKGITHSQARPMTMEERLQTTRDVLKLEEDPEKQTILASSAKRLRERVRRERSLKQKAALAAAAVGTGVVMAVSPHVGQKVADAVNTPEISEQMNREKAQQDQSSRKKFQDIEVNGPKNSPSHLPQTAEELEAREAEARAKLNPTPSLWERTAVPAGQEPTRQPRIDPTSIKKT